MNDIMKKTALVERALKTHLLCSWELRQEFAQLAKQNTDFINLSGGGVNLPVPEWVTEAMRCSVTNDGFTRAPIRGLPTLRSAIAEDYARDYGMIYDPDGEIIVTCGAMHGLFLVIMALVGPGDEVIVTRPGYPYDKHISYAGGKVVFVDFAQSDGFRLPVGAIADSITRRTKLLTLTNPHNPTGRVFTFEELRGLADLAQKHDLHILADEVFYKVVFDGRRHISMATLPGMKERTLVISAVTKSFFMPGVRVGWVIGPSDIIAAMEPLLKWNISCVPKVVQRGAEAALSGPQDWVRANCRELELRREVLCDALSTSSHTGPISPEGGFWCFPDISQGGLSSMEFAWLLMSQALVGVSPGAAYHGEGHLRVSFSAPVERLIDAGKRIADALERHCARV